jgi:hypothetical protein
MLILRYWYKDRQWSPFEPLVEVEDEEGIRVTLSCGISGESQPAPEIQARISALLRRSPIPWLTPGHHAWKVDLSALAAVVPSGPELKWLTGTTSVRPEFRNELSTAGRFVTYKQDAQFYLPSPGRRVFVVHGRKRSVRDRVTELLCRLRLEPVTLEEFHPQSLVLIEKFERYSDVGFAVVLFTGDDIGGLRNSTAEEQKPRARQNVVLELGYFLGTLGRKRVCVLREDNVEIPSDIHGVEYVPLEAPDWPSKLCGALQAAGVPVDQRRLDRVS